MYQNTEIRNRAARDVIDYIAKAEQWTVEYQVANEAPQLAKLVSFKLAKANAEELIAEVCRQADLRWTRSGTQVVIAPQ